MILSHILHQAPTALAIAVHHIVIVRVILVVRVAAEINMNERIKELESQCWEHDQSWNGVGQLIFNKEKFAELIIRQCGYHADVFAALGCDMDMDPTETKPSDYIKKKMGLL